LKTSYSACSGLPTCSQVKASVDATRIDLQGACEGKARCHRSFLRPTTRTDFVDARATFETISVRRCLTARDHRSREVIQGNAALRAVGKSENPSPYGGFGLRLTDIVRCTPGPHHQAGYNRSGGNGEILAGARRASRHDGRLLKNDTTQHTNQHGLALQQLADYCWEHYGFSRTASVGYS